MNERRRPPRRGRGQRPSNRSGGEASDNPYRDDVEAGSATLAVPDIEPPPREPSPAPPPTREPAPRAERTRPTGSGAEPTAAIAVGATPSTPAPCANRAPAPTARRLRERRVHGRRRPRRTPAAISKAEQRRLVRKPGQLAAWRSRRARRTEATDGDRGGSRRWRRRWRRRRRRFQDRATDDVTDAAADAVTAADDGRQQQPQQQQQQQPQPFNSSRPAKRRAGSNRRATPASSAARATATSPKPATPTFRRNVVRQFALRSADLVDATIGIDQRGRPTVVEVRTINDVDPALVGASVPTSIPCPRRIPSGSCSWRRDVRPRAVRSSRAARSI